MSILKVGQVYLHITLSISYSTVTPPTAAFFKFTRSSCGRIYLFFVVVPPKKPFHIVCEFKPEDPLQDMNKQARVTEKDAN